MSNNLTSENTPPDTSFANHVGNGSSSHKDPLSGNTKTNPAHAMVAGYLAGFSGTIIGYPLESLKVWVQTNTIGKNKHLGGKKGPKLPKDTSSNRSSCGKSRSRSSATKNDITKPSKVSCPRRSNSTTAIPVATIQQRASGAAARIIAKPASTVVRTVRALYSGVAGPLVTVGMVQSVNFATYDATRRFLYRRQHQGCCDQEYRNRDSLGNNAASGAVGGMATAVLTAPLLMIKINQQITGNSFRKAFREIFIVESASSSGVRWRFKPFRPYGSAFLPHALAESIGRAIYVTTYEGLKRSLQNSKKLVKDDCSINYNNTLLSVREPMACAAGSGILCWATFFPLDALRNRMYRAAGRRPNATMTNSIVETVRTMHKERAFYRGYSISILRAGPVAAAVLPVYDITLEWLSSLK